MLIAELRRKLMDLDDIEADDDGAVDQVRELLKETKEDLLTADVFGVLKYLPRRVYLDAVLAMTAVRNPHCVAYQDHLSALSSSLEALEFKFWPNYATPEGLPGTRTEPDVELSDANTLLLVEAKLHSGFGEQQVERELAVAADIADGREFFVLLVTASSRPPRFSYQGRRFAFAEYLDHAAADGAIPQHLAAALIQNATRVLWISWDTVLNSLVAARERHRQTGEEEAAEYRRAADMLHDLMQVMLLRGMQPFAGLRKLLKHRRPFSALRPVFVNLTSLARPAFSLTTAVADRSIRGTWRWRPIPKRARGLHDRFMIGRCCEGRSPVLLGTRIKLLSFSRKSKCRYSLDATIRRWPPPGAPVQLLPVNMTRRPTETKQKTDNRSQPKVDLSTAIGRWPVPDSPLPLFHKGTTE